MIALKDVSKTYKKDNHKVLNKINFTCNDKDFLCITGPSGCGKTTLLNIITGLTKPSSGDIFFDDSQVKGFFDFKSSLFRSQNIGFVFQDFRLIPYHSVLENVIMPLKFSSIPQKEHKNIACSLLNDMKIFEKRHYKPKELSGGQQQRVAIARAMVKKPKVILADEPTGNLDDLNTKSIIDIFMNINLKLNTAFIIATHDKLFMQQAQKVYKLENLKLTISADKEEHN